MSSSQTAFLPLGETVVVAADAVAPAGVQVPATQSPGQAGQYRVINAGTNTVFLGVGATAAAATATATAVAPVAGNPSQAIPLVPGAVEVISFGEEVYFSGLASGATTVYITPGQGV